MELDLLTAISPIDGRYRSKAGALAAYFSEYALIKYRVRVEIEYFITLCELPLPQLKGLDASRFDSLRDIYRNFSEADAGRIKEIESVTNHDVKAVEYFIKEQFDKLGGLEEYKEFIHFGLTSQDINNTSVPLSIKDALDEVYYPQIQKLVDQLNAYAEEWKNIPMLAKTHGQPASPTRLGKEIKVFAYRLERQLAVLKACPITAKFGGATGNYNAHHVAYPEYDWKAFGNRFVAEKLGQFYQLSLLMSCIIRQKHRRHFSCMNICLLQFIFIMINMIQIQLAKLNILAFCCSLFAGITSKYDHIQQGITHQTVGSMDSACCFSCN